MESKYSDKQEWFVPDKEPAVKQALGDILEHIAYGYATDSPDESIAFIKDICQRSLIKTEVK